MKVFQNESEVEQIGELTIENREDRLQIYGSIDITKDTEGLQQITALKKIIDDAHSYLSKNPIQKNIAIKKTTKIKNPFKKI